MRRKWQRNLTSETVIFEELLINNFLEQEALINMLERKGFITKGELLEEIEAN